jgi:hypothetical protein
MAYWSIGLLVLGLGGFGLTEWQAQDEPNKRTARRYFGNYLFVVGGFTVCSCLLGVTYFIYWVASCNCNFAASPPVTSKKAASQKSNQEVSDPSDHDQKE